MHKGPFNNYVDKMRGVGVQKMSVFVHTQSMITVHAGEGVKKWHNSVHVVVDCGIPPRCFTWFSLIGRLRVIHLNSSVLTQRNIATCKQSFLEKSEKVRNVKKQSYLKCAR